VQTARRFYNGQMAPDEVLPAALRLARAYEYHPSLLHNPRLLSLAYQLGLGPPMTMRPEATVVGFRRLIQGWTVMDQLHKIEAPTLIMAGRHDFLFPPEHQAILPITAECPTELVERSGHNPQRGAAVLSRPSAF
jgi:proline iminopeptidase